MELLKDSCWQLYLKACTRICKGCKETRKLPQLHNTFVLDQFTTQQGAPQSQSGEPGCALCVGLSPWESTRPTQTLWPAWGSGFSEACVSKESGCLCAPAQQHGIELQVVSLWYLSTSHVPSRLLVYLCQARAPVAYGSCQAQVDPPASCWGGNASFGLGNLFSSSPFWGQPPSLLFLWSPQTRPEPPCTKSQLRLLLILTICLCFNSFANGNQVCEGQPAPTFIKISGGVYLSCTF